MSKTWMSSILTMFVLAALMGAHGATAMARNHSTGSTHPRFF